MVTKELSEAAVEFNCILSNSNQEIIQKIPTKFVEFLKSIESKTYKFDYDKSKSLNEQKIKPETRGLISLVYENYICNDEERKDYKEKCQIVLDESEKSKREKYNPNNLFNKNEKHITKDSKDEIQIKVYERKSLWQKIIKKSKSFLKISKEKNNELKNRKSK